MSKKTYKAPELKSQKIQLGVFGDYGQGGDDITPFGGGDTRPWMPGIGKNRME